MDAARPWRPRYVRHRRLKPGVTLGQARGELASLATRMAVADADTNQG